MWNYNKKLKYVKDDSYKNGGKWTKKYYDNVKRKIEEFESKHAE